MNIDNQLNVLKGITETHDSPFAKWVYNAIADCIYRGKASPDFERGFMKCSPNELSVLVDRCLKNGLSDDEIIKRAQKAIKEKVSAKEK